MPTAVGAPAAQVSAATVIPAASRGGHGERVLIVDDDPEVVALAAYHLAASGYRVLTARSAVEGLAAVRRDRPDLAVVSARLPDLPGLELLRRLRLPGPWGAAGAPYDTVPVLLVAAGEGDREARAAERLEALALGADDVLATPLRLEELVLRTSAILRRVRATPTAGDLVFDVDELRIDVPARAVSVAEQPVSVTRTEFGLLHALAAHAGRLQTRAQLSEAMWGAGGGAPRRRAIDIQVSRLRIKLGSAGRLIETVRGEGYRLRKPSRATRPAG